MPLPIVLDRHKDQTLQEQIYQSIRDSILSGMFRAGLQLPSTRELAAGLRVSRNTAMLAYEWLTSEGYIETRKGAGTFVCRVVADTVSTDILDENGFRGDSASANSANRPRVVFSYRNPVLVIQNTARPQFDFWYGRPDPRQFPVRTWRRLIVENMGRATGNFSEYGAQAGHIELREAISAHLATARGFLAGTDRIIITSGAQDGLNIVCRLLVRRSTVVAIENPCYAAASSLFNSYGATLVPIDVDTDGIKPSSLNAMGSGAKLLHTTPSHQFPTGAILGLARRQALLSWANTVGAYVIEDDYDSEVIYDRPPLAALAALDQSRRVIYLGSFSKTIGAGIRIGYVVLPEELVMPAVAVKSMSSYGQSWLEQAVLGSFIRGGGFTAHQRKIRTLYRLRRDALIGALRTAFGDEVRISGHEAGLHLVCELSPNLPDADELSEMARAVGVGIYTPAKAGAFEFRGPPTVERRLVLGYAGLTPEEIEVAIGRVADALGFGRKKLA